MSEFMDNRTCLPLEVLDFLHYNRSNKTQVQELENQWPCELREYWKNSNLQGLVSVVRFLFSYGSIAIVLSGLLVNIFSLFILNFPPINKCNMSIYLKALAVSDIGALIFNVSVGVLRARFTVINNIYINHKWMCVLHKILLSLFFNYSTWIVVTFTFERLLMIRNPFKIHTWYNKKPAKWTVLIVAVITFVLTLIWSITTPVFENDNMFEYIPCGANDKIHISISMVPFMFINNIVPTTLITCANIYLLIHLRKSAQDQNHLKATDDHKNTLKVTRMLIIMSVVYIILYLPIGIAGCLEMFYRKNEPPHENHILHIQWAKKMLLLRWIRGLCFFIYLLTNINNFFLYCLSGDIFRQTVKNCVSSSKKKIYNCFVCAPTISQSLPRRLISHVATSSQRTDKVMSYTKAQNSQPSRVSENCYHNAVFSNTEDSIIYR